ncbi:MAG TPA: translation initiation factor IF-2 [Candidatus Polarisedimenticolaceae bacterium]|nr:translation initiation factor IF-2 [Candidatus Polarisedimenticolaceae bacterium]
MGKMRVHLLAKELEMETKDLVAQLERLGIRGRKAQSSLEDEEVARVRAALAAQEKPHVHVGEEKVVADRVVTADDESLGEIQARETIVERRVRANVIRRRTSRVEVPTEAHEADSTQTETVPTPTRQPSVDFEDLAATMPSYEDDSALSAIAPESDASHHEEPGETPGEIAEPASAEERRAQPVQVQHRQPVSAPPAPPPPAQTAAAPAAAPKEAARGARVLGRIDLKRTVTIAPAAPSAPRRPMPGAPGVPPAANEAARPARDGEAAKPAAGEAEKPKAGRHKKRVVKKQDVLEFREKELRSGRIPKKKRALPGKEQRKTEITVPRASKRVIRISEVITVGDLAREMGIKAGDVIKKLMSLGMMASINQVLDIDTATLVAADFDYQVENVAFDAESMLEAEQVEEESMLVSRPPVVTIMGHVDHGKTSLLDAVRSTNVTAQEHGGITQHIGAYHVQVDGRSVTFLDTPGHEAFTAMRARGAKVTDIIVLVVAADDGVMPQTVEAINHARAAEVPIIVAVNKIDKPDADLERVKRGLSEHGLVSEDWGGDTVFAPVSAKTQEGIPHLLEMLLLQADILELQANPDKLARGTIVEAKLDRGRGPVATVLVQEGTLRVGDAFVCGVFHGKVRAMINDLGHKVEIAPPSSPVEILGLQGVPQAGDSFIAVADESKARQVAEHRHTKQRETELVKSSKVSLEELYDQIKTGDVKELRAVVKADVQGSVEALTDALTRMSTAEVKLRVLHGSVGGITESDILLAAASNAIVIGFNVRPESKGQALAAQEGVDVRLYTVIYEAVADVRAAMEGMLEPTFREQTQGRVEIRQIFNIQGVGTIAGCYVTEGKIQRGNLVRILRDHVVVHEGKLASLKRFKDDVREVSAGYECGLSIEGFQDIKQGDVVEAYERTAVVRRISPVQGGREASHYAGR